MKLSPMQKYLIAFWSVTSILLIPMSIIVIVAILNPFWFRDNMLRWVERFAGKMGEWRDSIPFIKHAHDKAHLFDTIKGST